ncbi:MAG: thioredoxin family protein [Spirochaetales bacterium]|nr:thioredoxin family protein [Spirochaetales bacterium]
MKKGFVLIVLFIIFHISAHADEITWYTKISKALEASKEQKRYIMIDIYTDWCKWCKELDKKTYTHPSVIKLSKTLVNVKINPETDPEAKEFLKSYKIDGFPTILFIDWEKKLIGKIGGFLEGEAFARQADKILSSSQTIAKLKEEHSKGKIESSEALISLLLELEYQDQAIAVIEELRLWNKLPGKIKYYYLVAYTYLSIEYFHTALTLFDNILTQFKPGDTPDDQDYYYKSTYYKGFALASLGMMDECKKIVDIYKNDTNNPYARYFEGLLKKE